MDAMERLRAHLAGRTLELAKAKKAGAKIVGYAPGGFMPEEFIYAAGAIPLCLARGGDPEPAAEALSCTPRFLCTFCRSQIGYWRLGEALDYKLPDIMIVPVVDANNKLIADTFAYYAGIESFRIGIPHDKTANGAEYVRVGYERVVKRLEELTGNTITDDKLKDAIEYCNKRRSLLKAISYLRVGADPVITSRDYVALHHASFYADKDFYLEILQDIYDELKAKRVETKELKRPRVMLIASTLAYGDDRIHEIIDETDAEIVYEEVAEGMVPYLDNVEPNGDLMGAIVDTYFTKRLKGAWDRPWGDRFDRLLAKAKEFDCDGVIWYQTLYRDGMDLQAWPYSKKFKAAGLSFVKLETDYTAAEKGPMRTRIETFVELLSGEQVEAVI